MSVELTGGMWKQRRNKVTKKDDSQKALRGGLDKDRSEGDRMGQQGDPLKKLYTGEVDDRTASKDDE